MMSQRVVTECDECNALGETRPASTVGVRALSVEVEVDLCDVHVKPLAEMLARFAELGRAPSVDRRTSGRATCPRCGRAFPTPQALGRHARAEHGQSVAELRNGATVVVETVEVACPECGRVFGKPQALAVHRRRTHGVTGASKSAASRRRENHEGEAPSGE